MQVRLENTKDGLVKSKEHEHCLRCGRKLKNVEARLRGYGLVCYKRQQTQLKTPLF